MQAPSVPESNMEWHWHIYPALRKGWAPCTTTRSASRIQSGRWLPQSKTRARFPALWKAREVALGEWADAGPAAGTAAGARDGPVVDAAGKLVAPADTDSGERMGGRQGGVAGDGYGGAVWRQRGGRVCLDGRWGGLRDDLGGSAGDVGTGPSRDPECVAGCGSQPALFAVGSG